MMMEDEPVSITRLQTKPENTPLPNAVFHKELTWWSKSDGEIVGVVIEDQVDHDFSLVVLERNGRGLYNAIDLNHSIPSQVVATRALHAAMGERQHKTLDDFVPGVSHERMVEAEEKLTGTVYPRCPNCQKPMVRGRDGMLCDDCYADA
jgi:hypothetical protein